MEKVESFFFQSISNTNEMSQNVAMLRTSKVSGIIEMLSMYDIDILWIDLPYLALKTLDFR
jgi:hypothetical protein